MNLLKPLLSALLVAGALQAQAQTAIGEVFLCNFNSGQDMEDLINAKDFYLRQSEKAGTATPPAFVWSPVKLTGGSIDYLWFNYYQNVTQYGELSDAWAASSEIQEVVERFNRVSTCQSALFNQEQIFNGGTDLDTDGTYITSAACNLRPDVNLSALPDLRTHITGFLGQTGAHGAYVLLQRTPITPSPDAPDVRFTGIHNDAAAWANAQESFASDAGQLLGRHFARVLDCSISHWRSQNMVPFPDQ